MLSTAERPRFRHMCRLRNLNLLMLADDTLAKGRPDYADD